MKTTNSFFILLIILLTGCSNFSPSQPPVIHYQGTGDIIEYHANGLVKTKAEYQDGQLVSKIVYYASGTKEAQESYQNSHLIKATYYFASGDVKKTITAR